MLSPQIHLPMHCSLAFRLGPRLRSVRARRMTSRSLLRASKRVDEPTSEPLRTTTDANSDCRGMFVFKRMQSGTEGGPNGRICANGANDHCSSGGLRGI